MAEISASAFLELADCRTGHFCMESGFHSALWLNLDALFAATSRIEPFISRLADMLRPHRLDAVCGPLLGGAFLAHRVAQLIDAEFWYTAPAAAADGSGLFRARYRLPSAFVTRLSRPRVGLVDDVISAGSSLRATYSELQSITEVAAVGALLQLGTVGADFFAAHRVPLEQVVEQPFQTWSPADCPQCAAGIPVESVVAHAG
jgi:orotate phosphoribosyltransferase